MSEKRKSQVKKILYWGVLVTFVYVISQNLADFADIVNVLRRGNPWLLLLSVFLMLFSIVAMSFTINSVFEVLGIRSSNLQILKEYLAMNFINVLTPFGSTGGMLYMSKKVSERTYIGIPGVLLMLYIAYWIMTSIYIVEIFLAIVTLDLMGFKGLTPIVISFILLVIMQSIIIFVLLISIWRPVFLKKIIFGLREFFSSFNTFIKHDLLKVGDHRLMGWLDDINLSSHIFYENFEKRDALKSVSFSFVTFISQFLLLWMLFLAFEIEVTFAQVMISQSIIYLFTIISPTPSGVGIVEGVAQLVFVGIGIPRDAAVVITFAFRGIVLWIPVFIGFFAFRSESRDNMI